MYLICFLLTICCFPYIAMRRDDSSIDSLEVSPPPRKDQISLSRDSGLTLSDSQLYTPDEEESGSTSSSGYDPAFDQAHSVKTAQTVVAAAAAAVVSSSPSSSPGEYVRVYPGWEERKNANFQRQAWFRQRSKRLTPAASKEAVRRSASEESVLDGSVPPPTPPRRSKPAMPVAVQQQQLSGNNRTSLPPQQQQQQSNNNNRTSLPSQQQQDVQYRKMAASDYYNVVVNKSEVVVESLHPNTYNTELTIKPVQPAKTEMATATAAAPAAVRRVAEVVDCRRFHQQTAMVPAATSTPTTATESVDRHRSDGGGTGEKEEDSSTLSDEDCTPHVSRSNSRGNEVAADSMNLRQHHHSHHQQQPQPAVHMDGTVRLRGRLKRKEEKATVAAARSRSLPPPPPYRPPPPANRRAPITSYYLGECSQTQTKRFAVTRRYKDEESYV